MMNKKGFLDSEVIGHPAFWVLGIVGSVCATIGFVVSRKMMEGASGLTGPVGFYIAFLLGVWIGSYYWIWRYI